MKCLNCGRFCSKVRATVNGLDEIVKVTGRCNRCGEVDLTKGDWSWEDFFPEPGGDE